MTPAVMISLVIRGSRILKLSAILKKYGFFYKKEEKKWLAKVNASEKDVFLKELQNSSELKKIKFEIVSKKGKKK